MTGAAAFRPRVTRLALVSAVALGAIWFLAERTLTPPAGISLGLLAGWLLMPAVLFASLRWPKVRYAVGVPAACVGLALLWLCLAWLPQDGLLKTGWLLISAGVWFGGLLGAWFWYRWVPVPAALAHPYALGRWALIAAHVALVLSGLCLVGGRTLLKG